MKKQIVPDLSSINKKFRKCVDFNNQIGLYETVELNERFFIGDQWYGIKANNMPTPTFNFLKQTTLFAVASIVSDNMAISASAMPSIIPYDKGYLEQAANVINRQIEGIAEREKLGKLSRELLRNAAVDGDSCIHVYFDPTADSGQMYQGEIKAEIIENTRVHFGNPNCREVQRQPFIILTRRDILEDVQWRAEQLHEEGLNDIEDFDLIVPDNDTFDNRYDSYTDDKVTVITYYYKNRDTGTIWCIEATEKCILQEAYDTGFTLYPIIWMNWDYKQDCYHGQAMLTGLVQNQKVYNQMHAMISLHMSLSTFPKMVFDKTKVPYWNGAPGMAIGVNGSVDGVAKAVSGAQLDPQVPAILEGYLTRTQELQGASAAALGQVRPDNTSAIVALQRASSTPLELVKLNYYQCMEDFGLICIDIMAAKYGIRSVEMKLELGDGGEMPLGMNLPPMEVMTDFDFSTLTSIRMAVKLDCGASSFWSETLATTTLQNMRMNNIIDDVQFVERLPKNTIPKQEALEKELRATRGMMMQPQGTGKSVDTTSSEMEPIPVGSGNGQLQRALNREG